MLSDNLFYLALYSLCFFVTINVYLLTQPLSSKVVKSTSVTREVLAAEDLAEEYPRLTSELPAQFPVVSAQGVMVTDLKTGTSLFEKNADDLLLPASTVKMMSALVVLDNMDLSEVIEIDGVSVVGQKLGLTAGEKMTVENLLTAMLVYSANDAAEVLSANYPGGRDAFVQAMNRKAQEIGLENTYYTNPSGLDGMTQVTTARDLTVLGEHVIKRPLLANIVSTESAVIFNQSGYERRVHNTNELLGTVDGVLGIKTGWTENARENLVIFVNRGDKEVLFTLLGSQDRFGEMRQLIDWIFANYEWN